MTLFQVIPSDTNFQLVLICLYIIYNTFYYFYQYSFLTYRKFSKNRPKDYFFKGGAVV